MVKDCTTCKNYEPKKTEVRCPMCNEIGINDEITVNVMDNVVQLYRCPKVSCDLYMFGVPL